MKHFDTRQSGSLSVHEPVEIGGRPSLPALEDLEVRRDPAAERILDSGRRIEVESRGDGTDLVTIRGVGDEVELRVTLTADGPVLHFQAARMALESAGRIAVECDEFDVRARTSIRQHSEGDLEQRALGDASLRVRGDLETEARCTEIRSRRGDVRVLANDDVRINGERVRLNCG